jgi:hypothetical protein
VPSRCCGQAAARRKDYGKFIIALHNNPCYHVNSKIEFGFAYMIERHLYLEKIYGIVPGAVNFLLAKNIHVMGLKNYLTYGG